MEDIQDHWWSPSIWGSTQNLTPWGQNDHKNCEQKSQNHTGDLVNDLQRAGTKVTNGAFPLHGTVHFWGVFHWVLYLVPDTFLVPLRPRFQAIRTVTKTWRVNSADHWLAGENRHYCVTELATRDPPLQPDPLDLNQHSQRRIGRNFCLNKRTFLHQPQNSSVVVCWGSTDVPLLSLIAEERIQRELDGATLKEKALCITLLLNLLYFQSMFSVYIFTSVSVFCFN